MVNEDKFYIGLGFGIVSWVLEKGGVGFGCGGLLGRWFVLWFY